MKTNSASKRVYNRKPIIVTAPVSDAAARIREQTIAQQNNFNINKDNIYDSRRDWQDVINA